MPDDAAPQVKAPVTPAKRVEQYILLRDKIKAIQERHKAELAPLNDALFKVNGMLLNHLNEIGSDSITVKGVGTAYKKTTSSATLADAAEFRRHVIGTESWELVDMKANAPKVAEYIAEHGDVPPGVNFTTRTDVGVRRGDT